MCVKSRWLHSKPQVRWECFSQISQAREGVSIWSTIQGDGEKGWKASKRLTFRPRSKRSPRWSRARARQGRERRGRRGRPGVLCKRSIVNKNWWSAHPPPIRPPPPVSGHGVGGGGAGRLGHHYIYTLTFLLTLYPAQETFFVLRPTWHRPGNVAEVLRPGHGAMPAEIRLEKRRRKWRIRRSLRRGYQPCTLWRLN